jgi:hypothetical protein
VPPIIKNPIPMQRRCRYEGKRTSLYVRKRKDIKRRVASLIIVVIGIPISFGIVDIRTYPTVAQLLGLGGGAALACLFLSFNDRDCLANELDTPVAVVRTGVEATVRGEVVLAVLRLVTPLASVNRPNAFRSILSVGTGYYVSARTYKIIRVRLTWTCGA